MRLLKKATPSFRKRAGHERFDKIFFLHIPKCGGTSVSHAIQDSFGFDKSTYGYPFFSLDSNASRKCSALFDDDLIDYRLRILAYYMSLPRYKYIHGHFNFSSKIFQEFNSQWNFITILRDPVDQWFSQYFYDTRTDSEVPILCDLESFVSTDRACLMGNSYVRKLTDSSFSKNAFTNDAVQLAISNLSKFSLIGVLERLDIFADAFNNIFKKKIAIDYLNVNPIPKYKQQEAVTENVLNKVIEICQPNIQIYNFALERLTGIRCM